MFEPPRRYTHVFLYFLQCHYPNTFITGSTVSYSFPVSHICAVEIHVLYFLHALKFKYFVTGPRMMGCRLCAEGSEGALDAPSLLISRFAQGYTFNFFTCLKVQILCRGRRAPTTQCLNPSTRWVVGCLLLTPCTRHHITAQWGV